VLLLNDIHVVHVLCSDSSTSVVEVRLYCNTGRVSKSFIQNGTILDMTSINESKPTQALFIDYDSFYSLHVPRCVFDTCYWSSKIESIIRQGSHSTLTQPRNKTRRAFCTSCRNHWPCGSTIVTINDSVT
jgi:hypothetical protein